jgi:hypothetical protein
MPLTVAARTKAWTVFARSNTGIVGSNLIRDMDFCVRFFVFLLFCAQVAASRLADPSQRSPTDCVKYQEIEKAAKVQQKAVEPQVDRMFQFSYLQKLLVQNY